MENFYTLITSVGKAKLSNASLLGENVNLTEIVLGDGNGSYYEINEDQTSLRNEVYRGNIDNKMKCEMNLDNYKSGTYFVIFNDNQGNTKKQAFRVK